MKTNLAHAASPASQRLADLEKKAAELERELYDARESLARSASPWDTASGPGRVPGYPDSGYPDPGYPEPGYPEPGDSEPGYPEPHYREPGYPEPGHSGPGYLAPGYREADDPGYGYDHDGALAAPPPGHVDGSRADNDSRANLYSDEERTAILVNRGRAGATRRRFSGTLKVAGVAAVVLASVVGLVVLMLPGPGPAWPAGVAKVQAEVATACQNPDVSSEPGQVNFACGRTTRQILWVFALLTSHNNASFAQAKTGRVGLEPITPTQGGVVAWSLNLHHPYDPTNAIDSLEVAARAINNIIGGATVTSTLGNPVVQPGLESHPANCLRYTGSPKVTSHKGYPAVCAQPVSSAAGQAALVADVYQRWVVGAGPKAAQTAATLFENARNPGSPQVQPILKALPNAGR